ncbi:MAG: helix-turn-helix domain-containing protein [Gammaproteobacteria bacterium]|nr:helix-turn-helix domain-containing protein [Gammaproteobacteria bacterium]
MFERLLRDEEAAELIGMSPAFLRKARCVGTLGDASPPPPHVQIGRAVRYRREDLDRWIAERTQNRSIPVATRGRRKASAASEPS